MIRRTFESCPGPDPKARTSCRPTVATFIANVPSGSRSHVGMNFPTPERWDSPSTSSTAHFVPRTFES
jgi:hypothetical protein